jgi:phosphodiesterase/alkaline phosphatase D-like protein
METNNGKETNIEEETNFINFGCWNKIDNNPGLFNVVKSIKKEKNIDFFIINGDNYYQKKNKKKKDKSKKEKSKKS